MSHDWYQAWIEQRRAAAPPDDLPDRVMQSVMDLPTTEKELVTLRIATWIERSPFARCVACAAAMLIGSAPFVTYFAFLILV